MDDMEKDLRDSLRALMGSQHFVGSASLAELGWADVFEESPRLAVQTLFEEAGRAAVATAGRDVMIVSSSRAQAATTVSLWSRIDRWKASMMTGSSRSNVLW